MSARALFRSAVWTAACTCFALTAREARAESEFAYEEVSGRIGIETRVFPESALHPGQASHSAGVVLHPKLYLEDADGKSVTFAPFFRYDSADPRRTKADLREAFVLLFGEAGNNEWELRVGIDQVFWGVAESRHLVDIINQVDLIENPNEEIKLGQPMAHLTWSGDWGVLELFGLSFHRPRTFPGADGRLRAVFIIDDEHVTYESAAEERHLDLAVRYTHSFGLVDVGLSAFDGTNREPTFCLPCLLANPGSALPQHYEQIRQFGLDSQITVDAWLLKLEAIRRTGFRNLFDVEENYSAFVVGGEYAFYSVWDSPADLSVLAEWNYDEREERATNVFQNDIFLGARYAWNDVQSTDVTIGLLEDVDFGTRTLSLEFNRRLTDNWVLNVEATAFLKIGEEDFLQRDLKHDSFVGANLSYNY